MGVKEGHANEVAFEGRSVWRPFLLPRQHAAGKTLASVPRSGGREQLTRVPVISTNRDDNVLAHVHIYKCAGTSVRVWLARAFPHSFGMWYPHYVFDEASLEAAGLADRRLRALSSHTIRRFPLTSCGRRMNYFTLLRTPVDHVLSSIRYMCQIQHEANPSLPIPSVRAVVQILLNTPGIDPFWDNMQTNFLAQHVWTDGEGASFKCDPAAPHSWSHEAREAYLGARLRIAKDALRSFLAVGTVERIIESLELLRMRAAPAGFELLPPPEITMENVTRVAIEDRSWIGEHDPVGRQFLAYVKDDEELYAFAEQLLDEGRDAALRAVR